MYGIFGKKGCRKAKLFVRRHVSLSTYRKSTTNIFTATI